MCMFHYLSKENKVPSRASVLQGTSAHLRYCLLGDSYKGLGGKGPQGPALTAGGWRGGDKQDTVHRRAWVLGGARGLREATRPTRSTLLGPSSPERPALQVFTALGPSGVPGDTWTAGWGSTHACRQGPCTAGCSQAVGTDGASSLALHCGHLGASGEPENSAFETSVQAAVRLCMPSKETKCISLTDSLD